ncbi:spore germination protein [Fictibacillus macauensis ZFHKF-1]|uniref:Spore germination protein n=1 Tax=Fictibacillus macauensis ZFHKF-1 TaxID=1196324 RepID=I8UHE3_9BACL|nr:endospore germination permease [Fictibacillus macauensis]EIT86330.1 spore germination protein [Fictibacillus macauensis ZFHKF-1]
MKHILSSSQLFWLLVSFMTGSSLLMAPDLTAFYAKQDGWVSMLIAIGIGLVLNVIWIYLLSKYHYQSIFIIVEKVAGKWVGRAISLILVFYALHLCAYVVRNLSNFMNSNVLPNTNVWIFQIMLLCVALYSTFSGLNNLSRVNEFLNPIMALLFFGSLLLTLNRFQWHYFKPAFEMPVRKMMQGAYTTTGFPFIEIIIFSSLFTFVTHKGKIMKRYLLAIVISGLVLTMTIIIVIGCDGAFMVSRMSYPTYELMRTINLFKILERIEILIAVVWIVGIFVKVTICLFTAFFGLQHVAQHENFHPFILPAGILVWSLSNHIHGNMMQFTEFVARNWTLWWFSMYALLTVIMTVGIFLKKHTTSTE